MNDANQVQVTAQQWCLVTVRQWKREAFVKYLNNDIKQKHLEELIIDIFEPEEPVYDNMVLLHVSGYLEARKVLQQVEFFQGIQRLKPAEANRMLGK